MANGDRKAAIREYRERKVVAGIYSLRCEPTGACWIGRAPDLSTIRNRLWFTLEQGLHREAPLQEAWRSHGAEAFVFAVVEELEDEGSTALRDQALKARLAHWAATLPATPLRT